jgi:hypothetical protein
MAGFHPFVRWRKIPVNRLIKTLIKTQAGINTVFF